MGTTNLVTNPSVEVDTTSWSNSQANSLVDGAVVARVTSQQQNRTAALSVTAGNASTGVALTIPGTFLVGVAYVCSVYLKGNAGSEPIRSYFGYWAGGQWTMTDFTITASWARYSFTWTPSGTQSANIGLTLRRNAGAASIFFVDSVLCETGSSPSTYFDGATAGYKWDGTADASTSSLVVAALRVPRLVSVPSVPTVRRLREVS